MWRLQMIIDVLLAFTSLATPPPSESFHALHRSGCRTTKSMSEREQTLGLAKGSEVEFQTELNVTTGSGGPNLAKGAV